MIQSPHRKIKFLRDLPRRTIPGPVEKERMTRQRIFPFERAHPLHQDRSPGNLPTWVNRLILSAQNKIPRTYLVKVRGVPQEKTLKKLRRGVRLENQPTCPVQVKIHRVTGKNCFLNLKLVEGKNRHIKKICEKVGHPVVKLHRAGFGKLNLVDLSEGEYRSLTPQEIKFLRSMVPKDG